MATMSWKTKIRLVSQIFAVGVFAFVLASAVLFGLAQTNWGVGELARWVSSVNGEWTFLPGRVTGIFPFRFELERLTVADPEGIWLEARDLKVHWSPLPLIEGRIVFKELLIPSLNLHRLPLSKEQGQQTLPSWLFAFRFDSFRIDQWILGSALVRETAVLRMEARLPFTSEGQSVRGSFRIERTDKPGTLFQAVSTLHEKTRLLQLEASFHEDRAGLLGNALGVEGPLSLSLSGQGTPDLWQGKVLASVQPYARLSFDLEVIGPGNPLIKSVGTLHPVPDTLLGKTVSWELQGQVSLPEVFFIKGFTVSAENLHLEGSGEIRIPGVSALLDARFEIKDLRRLSSLDSLAGWSAQGRADVTWKAASGALSSRAQGTIRPSAGLAPSLEGKEIQYSATASLEKGTLLNVSSLDMALPWGTLQGEGKWDFDRDTLKAAWQIALPALDFFSTKLKGGPAEVNATVQGPLTALTLSADAVARDLVFSGLPLSTTHLSLHAELGALTKGNLKAELQLKEIAWHGRTDFDWSDHRLNLTKILLENGHSTLTGDLNLFLDRGLVQGSLKAECEDLASLSSLILEKVRGDAILEARFFPFEEAQRVSLLVEARDMELRSAQVSQARLEGQGTLWGSSPQGRASMEIQSVRLGDLSLRSSSLLLEGNPGYSLFNLASTGRYRDSFDIQSSGSLSRFSGGGEITLNRLQGRYGAVPVTLLRPVRVTRSPERIELGEWSFTLGPGQFMGSGYLQSNDLSLELRFERLPLETIPVQEITFLEGSAQGRIHLKGNPASPQGTALLQLETRPLREQGFPSVLATLQAALRDRLVEATLLVQGLSGEPLRAHLESPLHFSLSPPAVAFPLQDEIRGAFQGQLLLKEMAPLLKLHEQTLTGTLGLDLALEGTGEYPRITGKVDLKNGSYENLRTGTLLKDMEAVLAAQTARLVVDQASATDGEGGRISAQGWIDFLPRQGMPFQLDLFLENVKPFRSPWGSAVVGADLSLGGTFLQTSLSGALRVKSAEFRIPDRLPPDIADLKVLEINRPEGLHAPAARGAGAGAWPLLLDLTLTSPGRVFLSGRGLNTEWEGEIHVQGRSAQPLVTGTLSVVKGHADFLGKRFEVKKGILFFSGSTPPSPAIDLQAESRTREITARIHLTGPVESPKITLTSDPPFPPDEVLGRLLFGRSASNITPFQAVQLADSLNTLTRGGGFDFLGRTRRMLGLDQLTIKPTGRDDKDAALSAGKYLGEDVYIEVEQGISPETGKATLKWELTPRITVETEVGVNAEAGVGINWRWEY
mgnify:CR=1 FL=1